ncbi:hypothetical protein [Pseudomonas abyssi]|jgi:hypothetical protein|uniref:hypothetical protein n=1 Tax=Pseudomonas abyssi TaxID=170540 RepID=UPI00105573F8|nr:hypothetical protein [Pseudomonas abyssi]
MVPDTAKSWPSVQEIGEILAFLLSCGQQQRIDNRKMHGKCTGLVQRPGACTSKAADLRKH